MLNINQENHETRTFSRVFNICKPCLFLNVRFFMKVTVLLAVVAKSLGSKKTGTIDSARDERNEQSLPRRVTGNPENNIVYYTCRNLEIHPSGKITLSSVTALCMSRCKTRMHLLHAFSASVKNSLFFFLWI